MNKIIYTGITCYLGPYHFTRGRIYNLADEFCKKEEINFILSDNGKRYYIHWRPDIFMNLEDWRELQLEKLWR